jgi:ketosteroid isomerase-like protein
VSENLETVHRYYRAFAEHDVPAALALLKPGFVSIQADSVPWRGVYRGHEGVAELFERLTPHVSEAEYEVEELIEQGERVVAIGRAHLTARSTGETFVIREVHALTVRDGRLASIDVFLNAPAELLAALDV